MYFHTCIRCGTIRKFKIKSCYDSRREESSCINCHKIPVKSIEYFRNGELAHLCPRCGNKKTFTSKNTLHLTSQSDCTYCHSIPVGPELDFFKKGIIGKLCPSCNKPQYYEKKSQMVYASKHNSRCKSCISSDKNLIARRQKKAAITRKHMSPAEKERQRKNHSVAAKNRWMKLSDREKELHRERGRKTLRQIHDIYQNDPVKKEEWNEKLKAAFVKYKGDNHWMKQPDVYAKVKKSCEKYKGNGHWFHQNKKKNS